MIATIGAEWAAEGADLRFVEFTAGGLRLAIPLHSAERVVGMVAISPLPGAPDVLLGVINVHGSVIPVADVCRRLGCNAVAYGPESHLLLAHTSRRRLGLAVSEVRGVLETTADEITSAAALSDRVAVAGALGLPGGMVLIHDLEAFLSEDEERQLDRALESRR